MSLDDEVTRLGVIDLNVEVSNHAHQRILVLCSVDVAATRENICCRACVQNVRWVAGLGEPVLSDVTITRPGGRAFICYLRCGCGAPTSRSVRPD